PRACAALVAIFRRMDVIAGTRGGLGKAGMAAAILAGSRMDQDNSPRVGSGMPKPDRKRRRTRNWKVEAVVRHGGEAPGSWTAADCEIRTHRLHSRQLFLPHQMGYARVARQFIYHMSGLNKAYGSKKILEN